MNKATIPGERTYDREKQEHISVNCKNYPKGEPVVAIHDKNGKVHASWTFKNANDLLDFADMIRDYGEGMLAMAAHTK